MTLACAIYTRKSSEEGLDQDFNSLDAQREACEAFVLSQKSQGWKLAGCYDDGGFSGGNVDRPGLQRLMADITKRRVQIVVVYKVDRLTRSLADFAKLVELFDAKGVSFVSVTQQFNTTTSMGRLTLNVLLSFAQFEREVTGERIRDKIAASKRKGMWRGGNAPMGYVAQDRSLVIDMPQAERVREMMRLYLALGSVRKLKDELDARGWGTVPRSGKRPGGNAFSRGHLRNLLTNPSYVGRVRHKGKVYEGLHPPIVDEAVWQAVQEKLTHDTEEHGVRSTAAQPSLLAGLLTNEHGLRFGAEHANKGGKRFRYYVYRAGGADSGAKAVRIRADAIEGVVLRELVELLRDGDRLTALPGMKDEASVRRIASEAADELERGAQTDRIRLLKKLLVHAVLGSEAIEIVVRTSALGCASNESGPGHHSLTVPVALKRSGSAARLIVRPTHAPVAKGADPRLVALLAKASRWFESLKAGTHSSIVSIAEEHNVARADVTRIVYVAFLAPDIVERLVGGERPARFSIRRLMELSPLPLSWVDQRRVRGFDG
jgi:site-specific DNA recombinase